MLQASISLDCMDTQKDRVYALLLSIREMAPEEDPNIAVLIDLALDLQADHKHWMDLRKALRLPERGDDQ
jgi:hypothetical protein